MTNYDSIWGGTEKDWVPVEAKDGNAPTILLVFSWVSMVSFLVFAALSIVLSDSDTVVALMLFSLLVWLATGISYIRIVRNRKKFFRLT